MGQRISTKTSEVAGRSAGPAPMASAGISKRLALGAGCYWGTEKYVVKDFQKKFPNSIKRARVGFMSPDPEPKIKTPTYEQVCSGRSGHVEVLFVELKNPEKHFEELVRFFFMFHDPTTKNAQGNDRGFQYASYIFCGDEEQIQIAQKVRNELQWAIDDGRIRKFAKKTITTKIGPLMSFTEAHAAHQEYLSKNPFGYCNHYMRFRIWPAVGKLATEVPEEST